MVSEGEDDGILREAVLLQAIQDRPEVRIAVGLFAATVGRQSRPQSQPKPTVAALTVAAQ